MPKLQVFIVLLSVMITPVALSNNDARWEAEQLFETMGISESFQGTVDQIIDLQLQQVPSLQPYKKVLTEFIAKYMGYDSLKPQLIDIYTEVFNAKELAELNAFYQTETGKKVLSTMPKILEKSAGLGMSRMKDNMPELQRMVQSEMYREQAKSATKIKPFKESKFKNKTCNDYEGEVISTLATKTDFCRALPDECEQGRKTGGMMYCAEDSYDKCYEEYLWQAKHPAMEFAKGVAYKQYQLTTKTANGTTVATACAFW